MAATGLDHHDLPIQTDVSKHGFKIMGMIRGMIRGHDSSMHVVINCVYAISGNTHISIMYLLLNPTTMFEVTNTDVSVGGFPWSNMDVCTLMFSDFFGHMQMTNQQLFCSRPNKSNVFSSAFATFAKICQPKIHGDHSFQLT